MTNEERVWQRKPEWQAPGDGIWSQEFVAVVREALPVRHDCPSDYLRVRWVFLRWEGAEVADLAAQFLATEAEVRLRLCEAANLLEGYRHRLLRVLRDDAREILACMRNTRYRPGVPPVYATWKVNLDPGEVSESLAKPPVRAENCGELAAARWRWLIGLLRGEVQRCA